MDMLLDSPYMIAQFLGLLAMAINMAAPQFKDARTILYAELLTGPLWAIHFALLGATSGMWICILAFIRTFACMKLDRQYRPIVLCVFLCVCTAMCLQSYTALYDLLPLAATASFCATFLVMDRALWLRVLTLVCCAIWLIYYMYIFSIIGVISSSLIIASGVFGLARSCGWLKPRIQTLQAAE